MKGFKVGISFFLLIIISILTHNVLLLVNYLLALFLHELAHLFIATKRGYSLKELRLDIFGLSLELDSKIEDKDSFAINVAGPMCNLGLAILCMALYWLLPASFQYLNIFCMSNLVLAIFNLLPIYPLDGGKIISSVCKSDKVYRRVDLIVRIVLTCTMLGMFIYSCVTIINWWWLIVAVFLITSRVKKRSTMSVFKYSKNKHIEKVVMYRITGEERIYDLIKKIANNKYTIFFYKNGKNYYIDEDHVIDLAIKIPLKTKVKEIY